MTAQDIRICFIGDSFVNGTGDETYLGWTGLLCAAAAKAGDISLTSYNLGIRRNTSTDILHRWEQECSLRLPEFCEGHIVLSCGINDMVVEGGHTRVPPVVSCKNVQQILQLASLKYKTIMVGPAPVWDDELNGRIKYISSAYAKIAEENGIPFIEIFSHLIADQEYLQQSKSNDGYHPASQGYAKLANIIAASTLWCFYYSLCCISTESLLLNRLQSSLHNHLSQ